MHGFSTFHWDQLAKIRQHGWKERLKISKAAKFESDVLKTNEAIHLRKVAEFCRRLYGGGGGGGGGRGLGGKFVPPPYKRL